MAKAYFILYIRDQARSTAFYSSLLAQPPSLDVPGMTEFSLPGDCTLGLMPATGIKRLLGDALPDPAQCFGIPRCELYLVVDKPEEFHRHALAAGARELSPLAVRD